MLYFLLRKICNMLSAKFILKITILIISYLMKMVKVWVNIYLLCCYACIACFLETEKGIYLFVGIITYHVIQKRTIIIEEFCRKDEAW